MNQTPMTDSNQRYLAKTAAMNQKAIGQLRGKIKGLYEKFLSRGERIKTDTVDAVNLGREIGMYLQEMCGHEQIGFEFWQKECGQQLPFEFEAAKKFTSIARACPEPVTTIEEAFSMQQMVLRAGGLIELPEREEMHQRSNVSIVERFFREFTLIRLPFQKIVNQKPMEQWDKEALGMFLSETEWIAIERSKAENLKARL